MRRVEPAVVVALVLMAFFPVFTAGFVNWDDPGNIAMNPWLGTWSSLWHAFSSSHYGHFQPLAWLSLSLDAAVGGVRPFIFHLSAVFLHAASAVVLYRLIGDLLEPVKAPEARKAASAVLAASLWAVHPLRVEAVAWATERRELLAVLFLLVSMRFYVAGRLRAAFWAFVAAAFSKVTVAVFPLVLLAYDYSQGRLAGRADLLARIREKSAFFVVAAVALALGVRAQYLSGTAVPLAVFGVAQRLSQAFFGPGYYLWKTAWPANLSPFVYIDRAAEGARYYPYAALTLACAGSWWLARRDRALSAAHAAVLVFLLPSLGFFKSGPQTAADRFFHMASLPLSLAAAFLLVRFDRARILATLAVLLFVPLTRAQTEVWRDSVSLWRRAYDSVPAPTPLVLQNLAAALREAGRENEAADLFARFSAAAPGSPAAFALAGDASFEAGDYAGAEAAYARALSLNDDLPGVRVNHGLSLHRLRRYDEAEAAFRRAAEQDPRNADAWHNLGVILARRGAYTEALTALSRALSLSPEREDTRRVLALLRPAR